MKHKLITRLYRLGFRPKEGSRFFSPSLHIIYSYGDELKKNPLPLMGLIKKEDS